MTQPTPEKRFRSLLESIENASVLEIKPPTPLLRKFTKVVNSKRTMDRIKTLFQLLQILIDRNEFGLQRVEVLLTILDEVGRSDLKAEVEEYKKLVIDENAECVCGKSNEPPLPPYERMVPTAPSLPAVSSPCLVSLITSLQLDDLDKAFQYVSPFLNDKSWRSLARNLGLRERTIDQILTEDPHSTEHAYRALVMWRKQENKLSVKIFMQELIKHGWPELAEDIHLNKHLFSTS